MYIGMLSITIMVLVFQYTLGDIVGYDLVSVQDGHLLKQDVLGILNDANINSILQASATGDYTPEDNSEFDKILNFSVAAAFIGWKIVELITGVTFFNLIYHLGVPLILVGGISIIFYALLVRGILGYIRGV